MIEIEFEQPTRGICECCGNTTTRLTRFVYQDGDAYAVYYVQLVDGHQDHTADVLVSLGEWGEDSTPQQRLAFAVKIRSVNGNWQVMVVNRQQSPWRESTFLGQILDREQALAHSWLSEVFHITDHIGADDSDFISFFKN